MSSPGWARRGRAKCSCRRGSSTRGSGAAGTAEGPRRNSRVEAEVTSTARGAESEAEPYLGPDESATGGALGKREAARGLPPSSKALRAECAVAYGPPIDDAVVSTPRRSRRCRAGGKALLESAECWMRGVFRKGATRPGTSSHLRVSVGFGGRACCSRASWWSRCHKAQFALFLGAECIQRPGISGARARCVTVRG
jgi:hypothetical protein